MKDIGRCFVFSLRLRRRKARNKNNRLRRKRSARQESRVALRSTSLAASVAQNGYFDPNVSPAQHRNSCCYLMPWCVLISYNSTDVHVINKMSMMFMIRILVLYDTKVMCGFLLVFLPHHVCCYKYHFRYEYVLLSCCISGLWTEKEMGRSVFRFFAEKVCRFRSVFKAKP